MVIDLKDENLKSEIGKIIPEVTVTNTIMKTMEDKKNLAKNCLKKI